MFIVILIDSEESLYDIVAQPFRLAKTKLEGMGYKTLLKT